MSLLEQLKALSQPEPVLQATGEDDDVEDGWFFIIPYDFFLLRFSAFRKNFLTSIYNYTAILAKVLCICNCIRVLKFCITATNLVGLGYNIN